MNDAGDRRRVVFIAANPSIDRLYEVARLAPGSIHRPIAVVARPGGKGLNAARAAATLGARVTAIGIVGGRAGDWIVEQLAALDIDAPMVRSAGETRTCVSILDRADGTLTEVYERGEAIAGGTWAELEAVVRTELDRGDVGAVAFSGSLPPGAPDDGYARLARIAGLRSIPVLADTYGPALAAVLAGHPFLVKINAAEAGEATGLATVGPASAAQTAAILMERGAVNAIVTLGLAGAVIVGPSGAVRLVPPDVRGAYPVGSGDAFLAGVATGFVGGETLVDAACLGLAAGIANALAPGAGDLDPTEIPRILEQVNRISI